MRYLPALLLTALVSVHGPARAQTSNGTALLQQAHQQEAAGQLERAADTYNKAAAAFHAAGNTAQESDAYGHAAAASEKNADQLLQSLAQPAAPARTGVPPAPAAPHPLAASTRPAPAGGPGPLPGRLPGGQPVGPAVAAAAPAQAPAQQWKVGDKVSVGAAHNAATIIAVSASGSSYRVHHERTEYPYNVDAWYWAYDVHAPNTPAQAAAAAAEAQKWKVGDKVIAGPKKLTATIIDKTKDGLYYRVHNDNTDYPNNVDIWYLSIDIHARDEQAQAEAAAAKGPRLGKYLIYGYGANLAGDYNGYFVLQPGGTYQVFLPGGRSVGSGAYAFSPATATVKWQSGPFADKAWNGTQHFEVEREGKTHIIRLMARTIGTNSTDSQ